MEESRFRPLAGIKVIYKNYDQVSIRVPKGGFRPLAGIKVIYYICGRQHR